MDRPTIHIGPHALKRWRERINPRLTDEQIRNELNKELTQLPAAVSIRRGDDDEVSAPALFYRCKYKGRTYTAVVAKADEASKVEGMVVATVFPTDEKIVEIIAQIKGPWKDNRHLVRLRYLRTLWFDQAECAKLLQQPIEEVQAHWDEAVTQDRRCGTCQLYMRSVRECAEHDVPTTPQTSACGKYSEDVWEMVKLAAAQKIPQEKVEQAVILRDQGFTWQEIAQKLGVSQATIYRRVQDRDKAAANSKKATPELLEQAKQLRTEGKSWRTIQTELGISARTLRTYITEDPIEAPAKVAPVAKVEAPPAPEKPPSMPEPVCATCAHKHVCRYQEIYPQHHEWALCRWWCA